MVVGTVMIVYSLYELKIKPTQHDKTIQKEVSDIETRIEEASEPKDTVTAEVLAEVIPEEPQLNFPTEEIAEYKKAMFETEGIDD